MIVKVQVSLMTTAAERQCLIYNRSRSVIGELPLTEEIATVMADRPKAYFEAKLDDDGVVQLGREVPAQRW